MKELDATATFFRAGGRLRVKIQSLLLDKEFWMERASTDHRYKFAKVTGIYTPGFASRWFVSEDDYDRLQSAKDGDVVKFELNPKNRRNNG